MHASEFYVARQDNMYPKTGMFVHFPYDCVLQFAYRGKDFWQVAERTSKTAARMHSTVTPNDQFTKPFAPQKHVYAAQATRAG